MLNNHHEIYMENIKQCILFLKNSLF